MTVECGGKKTKGKQKGKGTGKSSLIMGTLVSAAISVAPILAVIGVVMTLIAGFKWQIDKTATVSAAEVMQGYSNNVDIVEYIKINEDKNIELCKDSNGDGLREVLIKYIEEAGLSAEAMGLTSGNLIDDIINAELVTNYPNLGGDGLQGIVNVYRRPYDAPDEEEGTLMTYVTEEEFDKLLKERRLGQD